MKRKVKGITVPRVCWHLVLLVVFRETSTKVLLVLGTENRFFED